MTSKHRVLIFASLVAFAALSVTLLPARAAAPATAAGVKLDLGSWKDLEAYVASQKGKVVVVDLWSTSCIPCRKEFPHLVKLAETHKDKVVCVSFCCDYVGISSKPPEYYRERAAKFLNSSKASFKNFLSTTSSDELFDSIELVSIPAVCVYGPDGKLAKRFDNDDVEDEEDCFTYAEHIIPMVEKVLRK